VSLSKLSSQLPTFQPSRTALRCAAIVALGLLSIACAAASPTQIATPPPADPVTLVRRAVQHRLDAEKTHKPAQYLIRRIDEHRDTTKLIIETKDGAVARLVAINGKPLTPEANQAELARLDDLAAHPELQEHRRKGEQKDADRVSHILGLLPDALLYQFEGMIPCGSVLPAQLQAES
jgi:hypothetical protein